MPLVLVAVESPVPVTVMLADALAVDPPVTYCTGIVQLWPGLRTVPDTQGLLPAAPAMEKTPPAGTLAVVSTGAAVKVNAPADDPDELLVTVIKPFFVPVPPLFNCGVGPVKFRFAPITVNCGAPVPGVGPLGVVTVRFLVPRPAPGSIAQDAFTVVAVGVPTIVHVMLLSKDTAVAPVRSTPVMVTGKVVPRTPVVTLSEVAVGPATVNNPVPTALPPGVVTVIFPVFILALAEITQDTFTVAAVGVPVIVHVTPLWEAVTAVAPAKPVPVMTMATVVPRYPVLGLTAVTVGDVADPDTVNTTLLLVTKPPFCAGALTLTL